MYAGRLSANPKSQPSNNAKVFLSCGGRFCNQRRFPSRSTGIGEAPGKTAGETAAGEVGNVKLPGTVGLGYPVSHEANIGTNPGGEGTFGPAVSSGFEAAFPEDTDPAHSGVWDLERTLANEPVGEDWALAGIVTLVRGVLAAVTYSTVGSVAFANPWGTVVGAIF